VYILIGLIPFLLRMVSGVETEFTRFINKFFSFNVFCVVTALSWLIIDPLVLSYAVVRCFYAEARTDGRDLLARLRPAAAVALFWLSLTPIQSLSAADLHAESVSKEQLSQAVQQAAKSDDYLWLRTEKPSNQNDDSFFARFSRDISKVSDTVSSWFSNFRRWLSRITVKTRVDSPEPAGRLVSGNVRWLLYALAGLVLVAAVVFMWRSQLKSDGPIVVSSAAVQSPDLNRENVLASDLPEEEWLRMARELLNQGDLRLAIRAMYLSNLSYLGSQRFIQIAKSKSNAIYERELRLRPRGDVLSVPFTQSNRNFERAWYGFHQVTLEFVDAFKQDVEALRQHVKA
jgi:hypothetical protein